MWHIRPTTLFDCVRAPQVSAHGTQLISGRYHFLILHLAGSLQTMLTMVRCMLAGANEGLPLSFFASRTGSIEGRMVMPYADAVSERECCARLSIPSTDLPIQASILIEDNKQLSKSSPWDNPCAMPITTLLSRCTRGPPKWDIRGNTHNPRDKYLLEANHVACRPFHSSPLHAQRLVLTIPSHISSKRSAERWSPGKLSRRF